MRTFLFYIMLVSCQVLVAQTPREWHVVSAPQQRNFAHAIPPGNYSGIAPLGDGVYAMVSDKSDSALYFNVRLDINRRTGEIDDVKWLGPRGHVDARNLDSEAIAVVSDTTLVIATEGNCRLKEWRIVADSAYDGRGKESERCGDGLWEWTMPSSDFYPNYVFESATFDNVRRRLWTINESTLRRDGKPAVAGSADGNILRLLSFPWDDHASLPTSYLYLMDKPTVGKKDGTYVMGVSELCALPDGQLLVLEREAFVPSMKIGAFCRCKIYVVDPSAAKPWPLEESPVADSPFVEKRLLTSWETKLTLFGRSWANYEGMCLGPTLEDGSRVLILVSDSQDGYAGVLKDWFKTIVISDK